MTAMKITKNQFILLLVTFGILLAGEIYSDLTQNVIPKEVLAFESHEAFKTKAMYDLYNILGGIFVIMHLMGFIGLFFFWSPARHVFLAAILLGHLIDALVPWSISVGTGWEGMFAGLQSILVGIIAAVSYWPAAYLFEKDEE